jgi:hypothetical protein
MKNFRLQAIYQMALLLGVSSLWAQQTPAATAVAPVSNYNYHDAFAPFFYTKNGTRSASGQPGAEYWQNRADYVLTAKLNEAKKIVGTDIITYTNNSPDNMSFVDER